MSNRWAGVRGWAGVGACSAEGVCGGRNLAKIRFRRPLRPKDRGEPGSDAGNQNYTFTQTSGGVSLNTTEHGLNL